MRASILATALCSLLAACGQRTPPPPPPLERVLIELDTARATAALPDPRTPAWALAGTWAVADARDAHVVALGQHVEVLLPLAGPLDLTCAVALKTPAGGDRDDLAVEFEMRLRTNTREEVLVTRKSTFHEAAHAWIELHEQRMLRPEDEAVVVVTARAAHAPPGAALCVTPPRATDTRRFKSKPNVLVISIDSLRADRMQSQGYARDTTPRIDTLLARGTRFQQAFSVAPWTLPSYGTLFTGAPPSRHRAGISPSREASFLDGRALEAGDLEMLAPDVDTLAARLARNGYRTGGFVSNPFLDSALGIDRGFERWTMYLNRATAGVELAQKWIATQGSAPWFCFLHVMDPHAPYAPAPPFDQQFAGVSVSSLPGYPPTLETLRTAALDAGTKQTLSDLYDGEIAASDAAIGKLVEFLDARGLSKDTLIVFHSDHGEEFWDHGGYEHGHTLHKELLHVPLGFVLDGKVPAGKFVTTPVSTLDVCATILALLGQEPLAAAAGTSLGPYFGAAAVAPREIESGALLYGTRDQRALVAGGLKLITDGGAYNALYDLAADPKEERDLAASRPADVERLRARLLERLRSQAQAAGTAPRPALSPSRRTAIENLGYPGPGAPR
jgi:arylsulfatase A-like enzyme